MASSLSPSYTPAAPMEYPTPLPPSKSLPLYNETSQEPLPYASSTKPRKSWWNSLKTFIRGDAKLSLDSQEECGVSEFSNSNTGLIGRRCRICFEADGSKKSESGRLISPCLCKGSSKYIHLGCLEKWRLVSPRKESYFSCDTCHYHYSFSRPWIAKVLGHPWFLRILTLLMILAAWIGATVVGYFLESRGTWKWREIFIKNPPPEPSRLDQMDLLFGLVIIAIIGWVVIIVGSIYMIFSECSKRRGSSCCDGGSSSCCVVDSNCDCAGGVYMVIIVLVVVGLCGAFIALYFALSTATDAVLGLMKESFLEVK